MKNKKFVKFLGVLISSLIVLSSNGQIFAKKVAKIKNTKQEEIQQSNAEAFKNFNENDYKIDEFFKLKTFYKNGAPILYYEHIKTKAKIVIIPTDTIRRSAKNNLKNTFNFNLFVPNEKGLSNFTEKAIISNFETKDLKVDGKFGSLSPKIHLNRFSPILEISYKSYEKNEKEFLKKLLLGLKNPKMLEDGKVFNLEKKRILNERNYEKETLAEEKTSSFNILGESSEIKNVTKKEFEKFFKNRVHPSNLLVTKYFSLKNPLKVKEFLKLLNENYLKYFEFKEIKNTPYNFKREIFNIIPKSHTELNEKYKYCATAEFFNDSNEEDLKLAMKHPLIRNLLHFDYNHLNEKLKKSLKEFVEKLGYSNIELINQFNFQIAGNNKDLFEKNTLRKNCRKIYNFILEKIINKTDDELKKSIYNTFSKKEGGFKSPEYFEFKLNLREMLIKNFQLFKDPFSKNCFKINEKNEIKDSEETLLEELKKDINKLDELKNKKELKIDLYSIDKKEEKQKKEDLNICYIPIKITKNNGDYGLEFLAKDFLIYCCLKEKLEEKALITSIPYPTNFYGSFIGICPLTSTEEMRKEELKFYETEFEDYIKNYNITKKDFEKIKNNIKESFKNIEEIKKYKQNYLKKFEELLSKDVLPNIDSSSFEDELYRITPNDNVFLIVHFKNFEEYLEYTKKIVQFNLKYKKQLKKGKDFIINKDYIKDYYELIIKPYIKPLDHTYEVLKKLKNNIENIKFKDFVNCVKSAKVVEKKQYEKEQNRATKLFSKILDLKNIKI